MKCSKCGNEINNAAKFCPYCGMQYANTGDNGTMLPVKPKEPAQISGKRQGFIPFAPWIKILMIVMASLVAISAIGCVFVFAYRAKPLAKNAGKDAAQAVSADSAVITALQIQHANLQLKQGESRKLEVKVTPSEANDSELKWSSSKPKEVSVDQSGLITAVKEGGSAVITVQDASGSITSDCTVRIMDDQEAFVDTIQWLNSNRVNLESIDVYAENRKPSKRNADATWDSSIFYYLEDIPDEKDSGHIAEYNVEKKQLMNAKTQNRMEYEIYTNPKTGEVNKIVSIEYRENDLELFDYYYIGGKVNFIFRRTDTSYTPTYASQYKVGERFYFNKESLIKWRVLDQPSQVQDYALKAGENITGYDALSSDMQAQFDAYEVQMLNAGYNTYNTVLQARSIGNIGGYITDANGSPMSDVTVKAFSNTYKMLVSQSSTDENGQYTLPVPTSTGTYDVTIEKEGYRTTNIYNVDINKQFLEAVQENIYLVSNQAGTYHIRMLLYDALNRAVPESDPYESDDYEGDGYGEDGYGADDADVNSGYYDYLQYANGMQQIANAKVVIRNGINNRKGTVIQTAFANEYGMVDLDLRAGNYTGELVKTGYETTYFTIASKVENDVQYMGTSPVLKDNEVRIVLSWGSTPSDLDSHLFTPYQTQDSSGDMEHIGFYEREDSHGNSLDVDIVSGYGPETMTITDLNSGSYKYYVCDYSDCSSMNYTSTSMSYSNALIKVYTKDGLVQTFHVPQNQSGVIWEVFEIRNKKIIPIQRYYNSVEGKSWWSSSKY